MVQVNPSDMTSTESTIPLDVEQGHQSFGSIEAVIESQPRYCQFQLLLSYFSVFSRRSQRSGNNSWQ